VINYIILILIFIFLFYIGTVLGVLMLSETIIGLEDTKRYCLIIPIISLKHFFLINFALLKSKKDMQFVSPYSIVVFKADKKFISLSDIMILIAFKLKEKRSNNNA
jgi:hypothetical protein